MTQQWRKRPAWHLQWRKRWKPTSHPRAAPQTCVCLALLTALLVTRCGFDIESVGFVCEQGDAERRGRLLYMLQNPTDDIEEVLHVQPHVEEAMNSVSIQVSGVLKAVDKFKRLLRRRQARQRERIQQRERRKWQREQVNRRLHNGVGSLGSGARITSIREDAGSPVSGVDGAPRDLSTPKHHDTHGIDDGLHQAPGVASVGSSPTCTTVPAENRIPEATSLASAVDEALSPRYVSSPHVEQA